LIIVWLIVVWLTAILFSWELAGSLVHGGFRLTSLRLSRIAYFP